MRTYLFSALLTLSSICSVAQIPQINLPVYTEGQYEADTILEFFGTLGFSGKGSVKTSNFNFVTGVKFYLVIDSVVGIALWDSAGQFVPLVKGDQLEFPVKFQCTDKLKLHILVAGTPGIGSETYACDLGFRFTTGEDYDVTIIPNTTKSCTVDLIKGIDASGERPSISIYPNPVSDNLCIKGNLINTRYIIYDALGKARLSGILKDAMQEVDIQNLSPGNYLIQIGSEQQTLKFVKK